MATYRLQNFFVMSFANKNQEAKKAIKPPVGRVISARWGSQVLRKKLVDHPGGLIGAS